MIGTHTGLLFDALPWWVEAPLFQLALLLFGMALDETYVNRTTVLTGALALWVHGVVAGGVWTPLSLYLDVGIVVGAYGLYAYVVDGYVGNWFRVLAYFAYSPLSILLVILLPDVVFPFALGLAGYANLQFMEYLRPTDPYYFGPSHPDEHAEAVAAADDADSDVDDAGSGAGGASDPGSETDTPDPSRVEPRNDTTETEPPRADAAPTGGDSTERGILPEFMRRL